MVGDRLDNEILPAKALGMKTIRIRQEFCALQEPEPEAETPDFEIRSLSEWISLLN